MGVKLGKPLREEGRPGVTENGVVGDVFGSEDKVVALRAMTADGGR